MEICCFLVGEFPILMTVFGKYTLFYFFLFGFLPPIFGFLPLIVGKFPPIFGKFPLIGRDLRLVMPFHECLNIINIYK